MTADEFLGFIIKESPRCPLCLKAIPETDEIVFQMRGDKLTGQVIAAVQICESCSDKSEDPEISLDDITRPGSSPEKSPP
jgi:hypothetical protein